MTPPSSQQNGKSISTNRIMWWLLGTTLTVAITLGTILMASSRSDINAVTARAHENSEVNAEQKVQLEGIYRRLGKIDTTQDKMNDKLDSILERTFSNR